MRKRLQLVLDAHVRRGRLSRLSRPVGRLEVTQYHFSGDYLFCPEAIEARSASIAELIGGIPKTAKNFRRPVFSSLKYDQA